jgi:hypothetical protein
VPSYPNADLRPDDRLQFHEFTKDDNLMVNATEMAKVFGKSPWKWLELPSTKEFLEALAENRSLAVNQLVVSVRGGNDPLAIGNWFHEDLALERWFRFVPPFFRKYINRDRYCI